MSQLKDLDITTLNVPTLVRLADKEVEAKITGFGALPLDVQESLKRQIAERRTATVDAAALEIVKLINHKDIILDSITTTILSLEKQVADQTAYGEKIDLYLSYGLETQNFLPLAKLLGLSVTADKELTTVPANWTPTAPAVAAPAAA